MKKATIVVIAMFLVVSVLVPRTGGANGFRVLKGDEQSSTISLEVQLDYASITDGVMEAFGGSVEDTTQNLLALNLLRNEKLSLGEQNFFEGAGSIHISGHQARYKVSGELYVTKNAEDKTVYVGVLVGHLTDDFRVANSDDFSMGVHFIEENLKAFITACIGVDNGKETPIMLEYGKPFVEQHNALLEKMLYDKERNYVNVDSSNDSPALPLTYGGTPTDYCPRLKDTATVASNSLSVSVYFQNRARFQTNQEISAKVNANKANFENFMRNAFGFNVISNSTSTDRVRLSVRSYNIDGQCQPGIFGSCESYLCL